VKAGETDTLYLHGRHTYELYINPQNPLGTQVGLESGLRRLDRYAEEVWAECERNEVELDPDH
jgi:hypothetical protein